MSGFAIRAMEPADRLEVAELICLSTNAWYQAHGHSLIFPGGPETTTFHFDVYQALKGSSGIVAQDTVSGRLIGSCFQRPLRLYHDRAGSYAG